MAELTRRTFLGSVAMAAAATQLHGASEAGKDVKTDAGAKASAPPSTQGAKLRVGVVGVGGRGFNNLQDVMKVESAQVTALCDVDVESLVHAARVVPDAKVFVDFRDMLKLAEVDAVLVATADHTHAVITAAALRAGKHVYCEKPLCHTIREVRAIVELADQTKLVTQTGIQMHATENYRRVVETIQSGAIGKVHDVHIWHNRTRRSFSPELAAVPATLNYDLWIGPAKMRPFRRGYHPYSWRHWWDFGGAQIGDQSSHFLDVVFWSLGLTHPSRIKAQGTEPPRDEMVCNHLTAQFQFEAKGNQPAVTLHWYDNPAKPAEHSQWKLDDKLVSEAVMFVGDKGMLCTNYEMHQLLPEEKFKNFKAPAKSIPKSMGHHREWVKACLANDPKLAGAPFEYGARLNEISLLGIIAYRTGKEIEWDGEAGKVLNVPEAEKYLGYEFREGWSL
ncbi:MAG TPA: Gfo/Idh/MocA family oxidoreductase [Tepidisphaeraceae bacterium]|jgi:predicted dehydrogenase